MSTNVNLNIEFGIPEHGWLPMRIRHEDFEIKLDVSDVPLDPMVRLCDSLIQLFKGINIPERIILYLEPYCYYLQLEKSGKVFKAVILESDRLNSPTKITKEITGDFKSIILPLFRALKKFDSYSFEPPNWERLNPKRLSALSELIKKEKRV